MAKLLNEKVRGWIAYLGALCLGAGGMDRGSWNAWGFTRRLPVNSNHRRQITTYAV